MFLKRKKKKIKALFRYLFIYHLLMYLPGLSSDKILEARINSASLCINNIDCLSLEIADTYQERKIGLMGRKILEKDKGMLFLYKQPVIVKMWMLNTHIKLDLIFIRNNKIISIINDAKPCFEKPCQSYGPKEFVDSVIEVNSGIAKERNLSVGQTINLIYNHIGDN